MPLIDETAAASANLAGLRALSDDQVITFTLYVRWVLPLDGYVFWLGTQSTLPVSGSLHVAADKRQLEDETLSVNRMVLTTGTAVQEFNSISPDQMWVGEMHHIKFAFSKAGPRYRAAGLFHYSGEAVYPALRNMLVPVGNQFPKTTLIVSNSLPMWLALKAYNPVWSVPPNPKITLYPSFALPDNLEPPYGVVHIDGTEALQAVPLLGPTRPAGDAALGEPAGTTLDSAHWQLTSDRVRVTLYGTTNAQALDFLDLVNRYSYDLDSMGVMRVSAMRDAKRTQQELGILAMKKTVEYTVSYYQARANDTARQLVEHVSVQVTTTEPFN